MSKNREFTLYRQICTRLGLSRPMSRRQYAQQDSILMFIEDQLIIKTIRALADMGELS